MFDDENEKEYIYKEPHATQLNQVCERLSNMFTIKFGKGSVELIRDSNKVRAQSNLKHYLSMCVTLVCVVQMQKLLILLALNIV